MNPEPIKTSFESPFIEFFESGKKLFKVWARPQNRKASFSVRLNFEMRNYTSLNLSGLQSSVLPTPEEALVFYGLQTLMTKNFATPRHLEMSDASLKWFNMYLFVT